MWPIIDSLAPRATGALAAFLVGKLAQVTGVIVDPVSLGTALLGVYALVHKLVDAQLTARSTPAAK